MNKFIRRMNTLSIHQISRIEEDMEYTQFIENFAFELIYWTQCLNWSNMGNDIISNQFTEEQIKALTENDKEVIDEFIRDMFDYTKWEREKSFVVEVKEITRIIIELLEHRKGKII